MFVVAVRFRYLDFKLPSENGVWTHAEQRVGDDLQQGVMAES